MNARRLFFFALAIGASLAPRDARAQCMPDLLDSLPCCMPISAQLPVFPAITQSSKFICFRDCATQLNANLCVTIAAPNPVNAGGPVCGVYAINFKVKTCGGAGQTLWQGTLRAHYARNWQEIDQLAHTHGVWRFLLNGDLKASAFLQANAAWGNPNVRPGCYGNFNAIYVSGYVDYAFDCNNNAWTAAWAVNHDCDSIHHPAGSPRAGGAFHPNRSWTFLGPGANFFVDPVNTPTASGSGSGESMRWNDWSTTPGICRTEEAASAQLFSLGSYCPCSTNPGAPAQYDDTSVTVVGACGSFSRSHLPPPVPLFQKRIGRWQNPVVFPGIEDLCLAMGDMDASNGCNLLFSTENYEGVVTLGGNLAMTYSGTPLGRTFMDLGSSNKNPGNMARVVGVPKVTQYIVNVDLP